MKKRPKRSPQKRKVTINLGKRNRLEMKMESLTNLCKLLPLRDRIKKKRKRARKTAVTLTASVQVSPNLSLSEKSWTLNKTISFSRPSAVLSAASQSLTTQSSPRASLISSMNGMKERVECSN